MSGESMRYLVQLPQREKLVLFFLGGGGEGATPGGFKSTLLCSVSR